MFLDRAVSPNLLADLFGTSSYEELLRQPHVSAGHLARAQQQGREGHEEGSRVLSRCRWCWGDRGHS